MIPSALRLGGAGVAHGQAPHNRLVPTIPVGLNDVAGMWGARGRQNFT